MSEDEIDYENFDMDGLDDDEEMDQKKSQEQIVEKKDVKNVEAAVVPETK